MQSRAEPTRSNQPRDMHHPSRDFDSRGKLAAQHLSLVRRLCGRYRHSGVAMEDLFQVGSVGLLKAIDKFDSGRGTRFVTFAVPVILGEIRNYFRDHGWAVKIPRKLQQNRVKVERAVDDLSQFLVVRNF